MNLQAFTVAIFIVIGLLVLVDKTMQILAVNEKVRDGILIVTLLGGIIFIVVQGGLIK